MHTPAKKWGSRGFNLDDVTLPVFIEKGRFLIYSLCNNL